MDVTWFWKMMRRVVGLYVVVVVSSAMVYVAMVMMPQSLGWSMMIHLQPEKPERNNNEDGERGCQNHTLWFQPFLTIFVMMMIVLQGNPLVPKSLSSLTMSHLSPSHCMRATRGRSTQNQNGNSSKKWAHPTFVHTDPFISQICAHSLKRPQNDCILTIPTIQNPISVHTLLTISHIWARHFHYIPKMCTLQWPVFCKIPYLCTPFP